VNGRAAEEVVRMVEPDGVREASPCEPAEAVARSALEFIDSARIACGLYAERPQPRRPDGSIVGRDRAKLSNAALAVAGRYIAGALSLPELAAEREAIISFIHEKQSPSTGSYDELSRDTPTAGRLNLPLFGWAVRALAMLGSRPQLPVRFLRRWDDPEELTWWLGLLDWHRSARSESLRVMNVGVPRLAAYRRGRRELEPSVYALMGWLQAHQDPVSGFWGPAQGGDLVNGLGATFHVLVVYEAAGRPVPLADRIAHTVIDLWRDETGWGDLWSQMAGISLLQKTALGGGSLYEAKARELARRVASLVAPATPDARTAPALLADVVTRLETLRAAAAIAADDERLRAARSWQSAWDPKLWVCDW